MKLSGILDLRPGSRYVATGVAALGVLAFAAQADAADIYAPAVGGYRDIPVVAPVLSWSGFYAGAHVGGAWANLSTTDLDSYWYNSYSYGATSILVAKLSRQILSCMVRCRQTESQRCVRRRHGRL